MLAQVVGDLAFFLRAETAEGAAEEDDGAAELLFVQRLNVLGQLFPQRLQRQQRVTVTLRYALEPARPQVGGDAG